MKNNDIICVIKYFWQQKKEGKKMDNMAHGLEVMAKVEKQKKKTGVVIGTAAALLVGGGVTAYAAVPAVRNTVNLAVMSPEKYCESVYRNTVDETADILGNSVVSGKNGVKLSARLSLDDNVLENMQQNLNSEFFKELKFDVEGNYYDTWTEALISVTADDKSVISLNAFNHDNTAYIQIPQASEKYISYNTEDITALNQDNKTLTPDFYADITKRYGNIIADVIADSENSIEKNSEGSVDGIAYKYNKITTKISSENAKTLLTKIADEAESDEKLKSLYESSSNAISDYSDFINDIRESADNISSEDKAELVTYVDINGVIRGLELAADEAKATFMMAQKGNDVSVKLEIPESISMTVTATKNNDSYTGSIAANVGGEDIKADFENICFVDDKYIVGNVSVESSEITGGQSDVLAFSFEKIDDTQRVSTSVEEIGDLCIEWKMYDPEKKEFTAPENVVAWDDMQSYIAEVDTEKLLSDVFNALGLNEEILESLMYGNMFNSMNLMDDVSYTGIDDLM